MLRMANNKSVKSVPTPMGCWRGALLCSWSLPQAVLTKTNTESILGKVCKTAKSPLWILRAAKSTFACTAGMPCPHFALETNDVLDLHIHSFPWQESLLNLWNSGSHVLLGEEKSAGTVTHLSTEFILFFPVACCLKFILFILESLLTQQLFPAVFLLCKDRH